MKNHSWIFGLIAFAAIIIFSITACVKDDDSGGPPTLNGCWHLSSSRYNETFTFDVAKGTFDKMDDEGWGERGTFTFTATAFTTTIKEKTDDGSIWTSFTKANETRSYVLSGDTLLIGEWEYKKVKDNSLLLNGSWHIGAPHNETFTFNMTAKTFEKMNDERWGEKGTLTCTPSSFTTTITHLTSDGDNWTPVGSDLGKSPVTIRQYVISGNTLTLNKFNVYTKQ